MSSAALSLDISHVVSRDLAGEPVDTQSEGALLAEKYRDLGMSGDLIGKAITRAAGMARQALVPAPSVKVGAAPSPAEPVGPVQAFALLESPDVAEAIEAAFELEAKAAFAATDAAQDSVEALLDAAFQAEFDTAFTDAELALIAERLAVADVERGDAVDVPLAAPLAPARPSRALDRWPVAAVRRSFFGP